VIAAADLYLHDFVLIEGDKCKLATWDDLDKGPFYQVLDSTLKGELAPLADDNTIFMIEETKEV